MTTFEERKKGLEEKYHHDKELEFKINARRNKLLGQWVADQLGLSGEEKEAYAASLVTVDYSTAGDGLVRKVLADCEAKGLDMTEHRVRRHLTEAAATAKTQIVGEQKPG
mgnify:CR=1 FL=1|jgi:hypothetical protein